MTAPRTRSPKLIARFPHANVTIVPYHFGTTKVPKEFLEELHHH